MSLLGDLGTAIKNKLGGTSVDNTVPIYNGTTCTLQGSSVTISDTNVVTASGGFVGSLTGNAGTATKLQTARAISITGDVSYTSALFDGSANVSGTATLSNTGVSAGTYKSVTVDAKGRITNGTNPTTLSGYGITDAYTKTEIDTVNLFRADKFLAAQNIANMIYTNGDLTKIRYNTDTDSNYEVLNYASGNLSSINHYTGGVLRGTTTLSYTNGNLVSAVFA